MSNLTERFAVISGRYLSNIRYLLLSIAIYIFLSLATLLFISIAIQPNYSEASFIAYEIATGGDPFNFVSTLQPHFLLWIWVLCFHVISWLVVPVIFGTVISLSLQAWDQRQSRLNVQLIEEMSRVFATELGVSSEEAHKLAVKARESLESEAILRR